MFGGTVISAFGTKSFNQDGAWNVNNFTNMKDMKDKV